MMRALILTLACLIISPALTAAKSTSYRLCPSGYVYAGDDTKREEVEPLQRDYVTQEIDRTDMYSCYKLVKKAANWIDAMQTCWDIDNEDEDFDPQLASFEDVEEMQRVAKMFVPDDMEDIDPFTGKEWAPGKEPAFEVLTSGMYFDETKKWYWTGSNNSFSSSLEVQNEADSAILMRNNNCLKLRMQKIQKESRDHHDDDEDEAEPVFRTELVSTKCFEPKPFICEARVQTVTYLIWFKTNWVDLLLGFLLIILFVALCISVCAYSSTDSGRSTRRSTVNRRGYGGPDVPEVIDLPPSYDSTVRIHRPSSKEEEANGAKTGGASNKSRMDYYKNRGKELMGKVYIYRNNNTNATTTTNRH